MADKCEMFMNCSKDFIGICKKKNMIVKHGILKGSQMGKNRDSLKM